MILVFKTTFEIFTWLGPDNSPERLTGGSSGIGLATAKPFVEEGAHVIISGRRGKELKEAAALSKSNVTTVAGDVSRERI
jgi:short-subunit dehydrogenase involved in D-alanine esterification of teichoic acids